MPTYINPTGDTLGTAGDDAFAITAPPAGTGSTLLRGLDGRDRLRLDFDHSAGVVYRTAFLTSDVPYDYTQFGGIVNSDDFQLSLSYYFFEDLEFVGTDHGDRFELQIAPGIGTETVDFDGGAGRDTLAFDFSALEAGFSFVVAGSTIASDYGAFAGFEQFEIRGTAANDVIRTGNGDDSVVSGAGRDRVATRGGDDRISTFATGTFDGGAGEDHWHGDYGDATADLAVAIGDGSVAISNGTIVTNVEHVILTTGSGDDTFDLARAGPGMFHAGDGYDVLRVAAYEDQVDCGVGVSGASLSVTGGGPSFSDFERVSLTGSAYDDAFRIFDLYQPVELTIDGGAGLDMLVVGFSLAPGAIRFVAGADGTVDSPYGAFASFERFIVNGSSRNDLLVTGDGDDFLGGLAGNDRLLGGNGSDTLWGGQGDDTLKAGNGADILAGEAGNDLLDGGGGVDTADYWFTSVGVTVRLDRVAAQDTGAGIDTLANIENLAGSRYADTLAGNAKANLLEGHDGDDLLHGFAGNDTLDGEAHDDVLRGNEGRDTLRGGDGNDLIDGGLDKDTLTGGAGRDVFQFRDGDTAATRSLADLVADFSRADRDRIALTLVDADATADGNQAFAWLGNGAFTGVAGQLHYAHQAGNTYIEGDTNGDGLADLVIALTGTINLAANDILL